MDVAELYSWCTAEIGGYGRTYYDTLEEALAAFQSPADARATVTASLAGVEYNQIWVPNSLSYVALGDSGRMDAWVGKTCLQLVGGAFVELPDYAGGSGGGAQRPERAGVVCPRCSSSCRWRTSATPAASAPVSSRTGWPP